MKELPGFGVQLERLLAQRRTDLATVAHLAGAPAAELNAVAAGGDAGPVLLRRLAPVLSLHTADLFVIAGRDLPADLIPASNTHPWHVGHVMRSAMRLYGRRFERLREFIGSLPVSHPASLRGPGSSRGPGSLHGSAEPGALIRDCWPIGTSARISRACCVSWATDPTSPTRPSTVY
jgi:hypothetical protein